MRTSTGKNSHAMRRTRRKIGSNNIVIEKSTNSVAVLFDVGEQTRAAKQALLFTGNCRKEKRRAISAFCQQACGGNRYSRSGGVIVRAGASVTGSLGSEARES